MTPELKKRIAQLRRGETPNGYRRGKLGIVPMEWGDVPFSSLFVSTSDYTDDLETYPLYSLTLEDGITAKTERYNRSHLVKKSESYKIVRPNDFAYNPMNIRLGAVARHKGSFPVAVSGYYDIFTTVSPDDLAFMDSFLTCVPMITYYNKVSTGSLLEKQRVHFSQFLEFSLPLPPLEERKKIGAILSAQDTVIELKERLLTEKRRQKKWLMQRLLTGKQRLPGFSGEWESVTLGNISTYSKTHAKGEGKNYVSTENMRSNYGAVIFSEQLREFVDGIAYRKGDVLIGNIRPYLKKVWKADRNGVCSADVLVLRSSHIEPLYFYYLIARDAFFEYVMKSSKGTKMPRGDKTHIINMPVRIPSSAIEQTAIADILSAADRELDLLRASLEQEKRKKKALSQLLLTGIVRV